MFHGTRDVTSAIIIVRNNAGLRRSVGWPALCSSRCRNLAALSLSSSSVSRSPLSGHQQRIKRALMRRFSSHLSRRADSREQTLNERACMKSKNKETIEEKRDNRRRHRVDAEKKRIKWMKREETRERVESLSWKLLENVERLGTPKGRSTPTTEVRLKLKSISLG